MSLVVLEKVWKYYGSFPALRGVSLRIQENEFVAIMGPSGSGKSTLLNIIGCLDRPDRGRAMLFGQDVTKLSDKELSRLRGRKIGFVFQAFYLIPSLTALENVAMPLILTGVKKGEALERAAEALEWVGLASKKEKFPNQLSGGEQQRVAIARAIVTDPDLILADEPTGNLDTKTGEKILQIFEKLHSRGKTIVMVTHDPEVAGRAERLIRIRDGKIVEGV